MIIKVLAIVWAALLLISGHSKAAEDLSIYDVPLTEEQAGADAVILLQTGLLEVDKPDKSFLELRVIKKILRTRRSEEGYFTFPDSRRMKIVSIRARAMHKDGREEILSSKDIPRIPSFGDYVMYSDQFSRLVAFDGTRQGTIIDVSVRWEITSPVYWPSASFLGDIPFLETSFTLKHRIGRDVRITALNMDPAPLETIEDKGWRELRWSFSDVEPFKTEEMMPPSEQFLPALHFAPLGAHDLGAELDLSTWQGIADWYAGLSADRLRAGARVRRISGELGLEQIGGREAARAIFDHVARNVRYVAIYLGLGGFQPHYAEEVAEKLYGDCKDQSVLLVALLREAGIEAFPVLVRTADLGKLDGAEPHPGYFNHSIAAAVLDGAIVYLDPTCRTCSFGDVHSGIQGAHALHVRPGDNGLITLPMEAGAGNMLETSCVINVDEKGNASIRDVFECRGVYAELARSIFNRSDGEPKMNAVKRMLPRHYPFAEVETVDVLGEEISSEFVKVEAGYSIPGFAKDKSRFFLDAVLHKIAVDIPPGDKRKFPLNLGNPRSDKCRVELDLPPGKSVEVMPEPFAISDEFVDYEGKWTKTPSGAVFERIFKLKTAVVPAEDFLDIRGVVKKIENFESAKLLVTGNSTSR